MQPFAPRRCLTGDGRPHTMTAMRCVSGVALTLFVVVAVDGALAGAVAQPAPTQSPYIESHGGPGERERFVRELERRPATPGEAALFVDPARVQRERAEFVVKLSTASQPFRPLYEAYLDRIGANGILDGIEQLWPLCHDAAHDLGKLIHEKVRNVGAGLKVCSDRCNSGCMHGVLMGAFSSAPG